MLENERISKHANFAMKEEVEYNHDHINSTKYEGELLVTSSALLLYL